MSTQQAPWARAFELFDRAQDLPQAERGAWAESLMGEAPEVRQALQGLLRAAAHPHDSRVDAPAALPLQALAPAGMAGAAAGQQVGAYRLLRQLGRGGMATVWLAERADGLLARQVALKLPHSVAWPSEGLGPFAERLAAERRILAGLAHPHIARLYDAGLAADGRPYLALEYVDGEPIDRHAEQQRLGVAARVELLRQVAQAVAYAHAQLVVHRDLKPSNVLVDAQGRVHLLDFGIAKLIEPGPSTAAAATARVMTPEYASPEQLRGAPVGTGTDIYSLGVLLFELLTGRRPPDANAAEEGPPLASRNTPDAARQRALRGDLDAILCRALAQRPEDRYPTMQALADDLQRYLIGDAVLARPANPLYRLQRTLRRHRAASTAAGVLLLALAGGAYAQALAGLALAGGAGLALWQRNQARQEAARARQAQQRAEEVKAFITGIFTEAVPRSGQGGAVTARDLLESAAQRLDTALTAQPEVTAELGALIGDSLNQLGETPSALALLPRIVQRCERVLGATHPLTLRSRWRWAEAANSVGDLAQAEPLMAPLLRDLRAARPAQPTLLVSALQSHAFGLAKNGAEAASLVALEEAVDVARRHLGEDDPNTLSAQASLSNTCCHFGRPVQALQVIEPALRRAQATLGSQRPHGVLLMVERCHADALARNNRPREGAQLLAQVLADQQALDAAPTGRVRSAMTLYANALVACGQLREGLQLGEAALDLHRQLTGGHNHEAAGQAARCAHAAAMLGDLGKAQQMLDAAQAAVEGLTEAAWMVCDRQLIQLLVRGGDGPLPDLPPPTPTLRVRLLRASLLKTRRLGDAAAAETAAQALLAQLGTEDCNALEAGLGWAEAARCARDAGLFDLARQRFTRALAAWTQGQVDGADVRAPVEAEAAALPSP